LAAAGPHDVWALGSIRACDVNDCYTNLFAEHWDGATWRTVPLPIPVSGPSVTDMQALGSGDVWAVGYDHEGPGTQYEFVLHWNRRRWLKVRSAFNYADCAETSLWALATVTPTDVWAAGPSDRCGWLVERWNGTAFSVVAVPKSVPGGGVDASSETNVWFVGGRAAARWDGSTWAAVSTAGLGRNDDLTDVAVVSPTDVWAIGRLTGRQGNDLGSLLAHYGPT
jgi:hypothetical protein